jgi:hypothetical protein
MNGEHLHDLTQHGFDNLLSLASLPFLRAHAAKEDAERMVSNAQRYTRATAATDVPSILLDRRTRRHSGHQVPEAPQCDLESVVVRFVINDGRRRYK